MMKKYRTVRRIVAGLILLPLVVFAANNLFFDAVLDPNAAAIGEPKTSAVPEAQNGYLALLALGADDGADGPAYAKAWLAETRAAARENRPEKAPEVKRDKRPDLCDAVQASCLAAVQDKAPAARKELDAYKEDLERYEKLIASTAYEEILDYPLRLDSRIPTYGYVGSAQRAYLVRA